MPTLRRTAPLLALAALLAGPSLAGSTLTGTPRVTFEATGSVLDIEGTGSTVTITDDGTTLTFTVPMATVTTDNDLRDDHMRNKYVEIATFPNVTLSFPKANLKLPAKSGEKLSTSVSGTFTAHGVSQPASIAYTAKRGATSTKIEAKFGFDVSKHGIEIPNYLGVTVEPAMKATVNLELVDG